MPAASRFGYNPAMRVRLLLLLLSALLLVLGAGCQKACKDADGDGRGENCDDGSDCDDQDPIVASFLRSKGARMRADPFSEYCPCLTGEHAIATPARPLRPRRHVQRGQQSCDTGCGGLRRRGLAHFEVCNGQDEDCDGFADEGVLSPCGGCNANAAAVCGDPPSRRSAARTSSPSPRSAS